MSRRRCARNVLGAALQSALCGLVVVAPAACAKGDPAAGPVVVTPEPITDKMCGACGMVVSEQPSPRGQIVYRDGVHAHACSLGDLALLAAAPSPHGKPVAVFVEPQDAVDDAVAVDRAAQPQAPATSLHFVAGVARPGIMGAPLLAFRDAARAKAEAGRRGGRVVDWATASAAHGSSAEAER